MYKHIVVWTLVRRTDAQQVVKRLEEVLIILRSTIPGLLKIEVAADISEGDNAGDLLLYSEFDSRASFLKYDGSSPHQLLKKISVLIGNCGSLLITWFLTVSSFYQ